MSGARRQLVMTDAAIIGENVEIIATNGGTTTTPFSWGAAIAGAIAALAVGFLVISLGSGIGLSLSSPYSSGPSLTTLTIAGAIWLFMALLFGAAAATLAGMLGGELRDRDSFGRRVAATE